jgi:hypothetical protein
MTLQPGYRFLVAPRFYLPADWPRRLLVGAGVEEAGGWFHPRHSWRPPTADELPLLVQTSGEPTPAEDLEDGVCLFQLPGHLRSEWWRLLAQAADVLGGGRLPGFEMFVNQVVEFLAFKDLPVPEGALCEAVVSDPGRSLPGGLRCHLAAGAERLWGGINLGDEETSVVLLNLSPQQLEAEVRRRFPDDRIPASAAELAGRFLRCCSDYPAVRLALGPGDGYRVPRSGLILGGDREGKQVPDVLLLISYQGSAGP